MSLITGWRTGADCSARAPCTQAHKAREPRASQVTMMLKTMVMVGTLCGSIAADGECIGAAGALLITDL